MSRAESSKLPPTTDPTMLMVYRSQESANGAKRAFMAAHARKAELAKRLLDDTWRAQVKQREWNYKRQIGMLTTSIKPRDENFLRRENKSRRRSGEQPVRTTTGARQLAPLPRDLQSSLYPRHHRLYFGE